MEKSAKPVIVVSGGNGYLGNEIIRHFENRGFETISLSRSANTYASVSFECDVADENAVLEAAKKVIEKFGRVDVCVHTASANGKESFEVQERIALGGGKSLSNAFLPHMDGGVFIGITTKFLSDGVEPPPLDSYIRAKRALKDFLRDLSSQSEAVRVYAVAPGYLPGGLNKDVPKEMLEFLALKSKAGMTSKEAVAELIYRIATEPDHFKSGVSIDIPGDAITSL